MRVWEIEVQWFSGFYSFIDRLADKIYFWKKKENLSVVVSCEYDVI